MGGSAVSQIQIDEALVRNASVLRYRLKVTYGLLIKPNGDLLFKLGSIWIFPGGGKVVFFAHMTPFTDKTWTLWDLLCGLR